MTFPRVESERLMLLLSVNAVPELFEMPEKQLHLNFGFLDKWRVGESITLIQVQAFWGNHFHEVKTFLGLMAPP